MGLQKFLNLKINEWELFEEISALVLSQPKQFLNKFYYLGLDDLSNDSVLVREVCEFQSEEETWRFSMDERPCGAYLKIVTLNSEEIYLVLIGQYSGSRRKVFNNTLTQETYQKRDRRLRVFTPEEMALARAELGGAFQKFKGKLSA